MTMTMSRGRIAGSVAVGLIALLIGVSAVNAHEQDAANKTHATATADRQIALHATMVTRAHVHATARVHAHQTQVVARRRAAPHLTAAAHSAATSDVIVRATAHAEAAIAAQQARQAAAAEARQTQQASVLLDLQGSGIQKTQKFTTNGDEWKIEWSYDCSSFASQGNFQIYVTDESGVPDPVVNELNDSGSGTDYEHTGGTFYLEMNSECDWHVRVFSP